MGEPKVNLAILEEMVGEAGEIEIWHGQRLAGVELGDLAGGRRRVEALVVVDVEGASRRVVGGVVIDGSYEGDLMAMAGEPYHVGRESRWQYGEPMAGDAQGRADGQVQGYNFRLVMTRDAGKRVAVPQPEGYRRSDFEGVLPVLERGEIESVFHAGHGGIFRAHMPLLPNGKADVNDTPRAPVRLSMPDINDGWPEACADERSRIYREHLYYHLGLLWFLQNDDAVPERYRDPAAEWGFCRDEFEDSGHVPPQLYVREARRMVGQHVFTLHDTARQGDEVRARWWPDSIASGDYIHNCHGTGREGGRFGGKNTGEFYHRNPPFQVRYGVLVPQRSANLLVACAVSASHVGFCALRLEPTWMVLGQAAGTAAHVALRDGVAVQEIDVAAVQALLHGAGLATLYLSDVAPGHGLFGAVQWIGARGGWHGLYGEAGEVPAPRGLGGQYSEAFLFHEAGLDKELDAPLLARWQGLLPEGIREAMGAGGESLGGQTRGEFLAKLWGMIGREAGGGDE